MLFHYRHGIHRHRHVGIHEQHAGKHGDLTIIEVSQGTSSDGKVMKLDDNARNSFSEIPGVQAVLPKMDLGEYTAKLYAGANNRYQNIDYPTIMGVETEALEDMGYEFLEGKTATTGKDEAVGGQYLAYSFKDSLLPDGSNMVDRWGEYDENGNQIGEIDDPYFDPLKTPITLELTDSNENTYQRELQVTGLVKEDYGKGYETSEGLMVSIATLKDIISTMTGMPVSKTEYTSMNVKATDINTVADVEAQIKGMGYNTYSMSSMREEMEKSARQTQLMLGGLGAISLFVAAIGITNTMIMSISERTKEIGIMKALGCYVRDIRAMFLMEAGMIGLLGGIFGSIVSLVIFLGHRYGIYRNGIYQGGSDNGDHGWRRGQPYFSGAAVADSVCHCFFDPDRSDIGILSCKQSCENLCTGSN